MYEAIAGALRDGGVEPDPDLVLLIEERVAAHLDQVGWVEVE